MRHDRVPYTLLTHPFIYPISYTGSLLSRSLLPSTVRPSLSSSNGRVIPPSARPARFCSSGPLPYGTVHLTSSPQCSCSQSGSGDFSITVSRIEHTPVPPIHSFTHSPTSGVTSVRPYSFCGYVPLLEIEALISPLGQGGMGSPIRPVRRHWRVPCRSQVIKIGRAHV